MLLDPDAVVLRAWGLQDRGQSSEAWDLLQPLVQAGVSIDMLGVLYTRVALSTHREADALPYIERLLALPDLRPDARAALHAGSAALLDRLGSYDLAFQQMRLGKQANAPPHNRWEFIIWANADIAYFTPNKLNFLPRASHGDARTIFIVGMPRSGTSLVEQILGSHPLVHAGGESPGLANAWEMAHEMFRSEGELFPNSLDAMGLKQANQLASLYLSTRPKVPAGATYVTDKMPTNFLMLSLIATLFPDSHVIHCRRDTLDTCLSCYATAFHPPLAFTHSQTDLGSFYRDYHRMMDHWANVLKFPMVDVSYENLVRDQEGETRRLLEALKLPWDDRCLQFHQNERVVATASRDQVKQPIYASSIGRAKQYRKHLDELVAAIGLPLDAAAPATSK